MITHLLTSKHSQGLCICLFSSAPPSPTEHVNGGSISGNRLNNSLKLWVSLQLQSVGWHHFFFPSSVFRSNSHSQLDHNYQFQNSSLVRSVTPHLGMQESYSASTPRITRLPSMSESYSASVTRMHSMSENPPSTSVSNGHVPHFFSPISIENGSPKFSYPLPNNVHVSKAPLPSDFYTSTLLQYRIAGNFAEGLNLAIWRILSKMSILKLTNNYSILYTESMDHVLKSPKLKLAKCIFFRQFAKYNALIRYTVL